jgi:type IV pilus biogenesis protein PilP
MKLQFSEMTTRQKITGVIFIVVLIIIGWQGMSLLNSTSSAPPLAVAANQQAMAMRAPKPMPVVKQPAQLTPREMQLMQMQQALEAKYVAAINELQMLKLEREIVENNKAIVAARLDTVALQQKIVNLLTAPSVPPGAYSQGLEGGAAPAQPPQPPQQPSYSVVSVSQLQHRWSAVMGYQGHLYQIYVGDIMPPDGSKVIEINKSGVWLSKDNEKRKVSLVPVI